MSLYDNEEYLEAKNKLKGDYAASFRKAETYIHASNCGTKVEESCMMQILDDFLTAQDEEKPVSRITGPDLRKFCDNIMYSERDRISNRRVNHIEFILTLLITLILIIFCRSLFLYMKDKTNLNFMHNLRLETYEIMFTFIFILSYGLKKAVSVLLFEHTAISKFFNGIINFILLGMSGYIAKELDKMIRISIPVSMPIYIVITALTLLALILCIIINHKAKVKTIETQDENYDEIGTVICPECGKEYECDYPKCPYCKHIINE